MYNPQHLIFNVFNWAANKSLELLFGAGGNNAQTFGGGSFSQPSGSFSGGGSFTNPGGNVAQQGFGAFNKPGNH